MQQRSNLSYSRDSWDMPDFWWTDVPLPLRSSLGCLLKNPKVIGWRIISIAGCEVEYDLLVVKPGGVRRARFYFGQSGGTCKTSVTCNIDKQIERGGWVLNQPHPEEIDLTHIPEPEEEIHLTLDTDGDNDDKNLETWSLGSWGKGGITPSGNCYIWKTSCGLYGTPYVSSPETLALFTEADGDAEMHSEIVIAPDGQYTWSGDSTSGDEEQFLAVGNLVYIPDPEQWHQQTYGMPAFAGAA